MWPFKTKIVVSPKIGEIRSIYVNDTDNPFKSTRPKVKTIVKDVKNGYVLFGVVGVDWDNRSMKVEDFVSCYSVIEEPGEK